MKLKTKSLTLFLSLVLSAFFCKISAQDISSDTIKFHYSGVVSVIAVPSNTLYERAKRFISETFAYAGNNVQVDNSDMNILIARCTLHPDIRNSKLFGSGDYGYVNYVIKVQCRDGKFKYTITDFYHEMTNKPFSGGRLAFEKPACGVAKLTMDRWRKIKASVNLQIIDLIRNMEKAMKANDLTASSEDF